MGRIVYHELNDLVIAADATQDLWSVFGGAGTQVKMHGWELTSDALTATLLSMVFRRITAVGSGGNDPNAEELRDEQDGSIASNVRTEDTTPGTGGGNMMGYSWEQLGPAGHIWTPEMQPISKAQEGFSLLCNTAVIATLSGFICWEEIGV